MTTTTPSAREILEKHFNKDWHSFERWSIMTTANSERASAILAAMEEIAKLSWEASEKRINEEWSRYQNGMLDITAPNKETFMKTFFREP